MVPVMAFLSGINKWVYIALAGFLAVTAAVVTISHYSAKMERLEIELKETQAVLQDYRLKSEEAVKLRASYNSLVVKNRDLKKKLANALNRVANGKKPISGIAIKKPKVVEKIINEGTKNRLECLNKISKGESHESCK